MITSGDLHTNKTRQIVASLKLCVLTDQLAESVRVPAFLLKGKWSSCLSLPIKFSYKKWLKIFSGWILIHLLTEVFGTFKIAYSSVGNQKTEITYTMFPLEIGSCRK